MIYLHSVTGNALLFISEEDTVWHRQLTFPLLTLWLTLQSFPRETPFVFQVENLVNLLAVPSPLLF